MYLDDAGSDSNAGTLAKPFKTLTKCYNTLGTNGGAMVIKSTFTQTGTFKAPIEHTGKITIMGYTNTSSYSVAGHRYHLGGPTEFTGITINQTAANFLISARYYNLTISHSVKKTDSYICIIVAGGQGGADSKSMDYTPRSSTVTVNGGNWSEIVGGVRTSLNTPNGAKSADAFKNITTTINVGGTASLNRIAAFSRAFTSSENLIEGSECIINLNGGKVKRWIAMSDTTKTGKNGFADGLTINIGAGFDFAGSFKAVSGQVDNIKDDVFYGINGDSVYTDDSYGKVGKTKVVFADAIYEAYKNSDPLRGVTVECENVGNETTDTTTTSGDTTVTPGDTTATPDETTSAPKLSTERYISLTAEMTRMTA